MAILRFIFIFILIYLLYKLVQSFFVPQETRNKEITHPHSSSGEDDMEKDPYCQVYIPKGDAFPEKIQGELLYFCSKDCLEKYKKERM